MSEHNGELTLIRAVILAAIGDEPVYGARIPSMVERRTGQVVKRGTLYATLHRMARAGLIRYVGCEPSTNARGGNTRQMLRRTRQGAAWMQSLRTAIGEADGEEAKVT